MKKILFVIPSLKVGGAELFLLRFCENLNSNYNLTVVVLGTKEGLANQFEKLPIRVIYLGFERVTQFIPAILKLRRTLIEIKPHLIETFLYYSDIVTSLAKVRLKIPLVWSIRGTSLAKQTKWHKIATQRLASLFSKFSPDLIIACGETPRIFHESLGYPSDKIVVIGNFPADFTKQIDNNSIFKVVDSPVSFTIGLAARYDLGKGHESLVHGVIKFLKGYIQVQEITISFAGKGCESEGRLERDLLSSKLVQEFLENRRLKFYFCGPLSEAQMIKWYESIDLYFMASDSLEGFPNSLAESLSAGIPSLSTPVGEAKTFLSSFYLCDSAKSSEISKTLSRIYSQKATSIQSEFVRVKSSMQLQYSKERVLASYKGAWNELME